MKNYISILLVATAFLSAPVFAHTTLKSSTPTNNAMLMKSPTNVALSFGSDVRLVSLAVLNDKSEEVATSFVPTMEASQSFTYDLPALMQNTYTVSWTIMGEDGHKMKGDFSFMVHAMDKMESMKNKEIDHSQHRGH